MAPCRAEERLLQKSFTPNHAIDRMFQHTADPGKRSPLFEAMTTKNIVIDSGNKTRGAVQSRGTSITEVLHPNHAIDRMFQHTADPGKRSPLFEAMTTKNIVIDSGNKIRGAVQSRGTSITEVPHPNHAIDRCPNLVANRLPLETVSGGRTPRRKS